ncbi:hypothetical protein O3G_MSEX009712 [Manduca sexta]|uniref:Reverse transcriptase domain-containing protein n=1 Tax=Manduca sexta TaxID=7130 RepID=A0A921ZEL9_MANSE|nr:hypothetical protein O3G_MSEX009712 [Manduca sexta]
MLLTLTEITYWQPPLLTIKTQFLCAVTALLDAHAPLKKIKLKRPPAPWITHGVRMAMRRRDRAFRQYRRHRSEENWCLFKAARNRCNQMVRNAKRRHILSNISSYSPASIWRFLGILGIGKVKNIDVHGATIGLDDINKHFTSVTMIDHQTRCRAMNILAGLSRPNINTFHFSSVPLGEIRKVILSIKYNATGCDNINRRMIIPILDQLLPIMSHIINASLSTGIFPSLWRRAIAIPLPKIPNPSLTKHFRPIPIPLFLLKVLEACAHKQLSEHVHRNNLLCPLQSGFRPSHSTITALLKVTGDIRAGMEDSNVTVLALVDFSNAFNTVSHNILLANLSHLMISPTVQLVRLDDSSSSWRDIDCGVPQGGIISPLLFSIFIHLLTQNLQCAYHLYTGLANLF